MWYRAARYCVGTVTRHGLRLTSLTALVTSASATVGILSTCGQRRYQVLKGMVVGGLPAPRRGVQAYQAVHRECVVAWPGGGGVLASV